MAWPLRSPSGSIEGLKHESALHGDELVCIQKSRLTRSYEGDVENLFD
jgi:hypothetical protein